MSAPTQPALGDEQAFALHERCDAAAYGLDREQFAAILRDIQSKYLPLASPNEAADFCGALRLEELVLARGCAAGNERAWQDFAAIVIANLASFIGGEVMAAYGWFGLFG